MVSVVEMLINTAKTKPDVVAVQDENQKVMYGELFNMSCNLAYQIQKKIQKHNNIVLIVTQKSIESIVSIWGVICSGNCYVAVDAKTPQNRFDKIVNQILPDLILFTDESQASMFVVERPTLVVKVDELKCNRSYLSEYDLLNGSVIDEDPLYMVFTSGSTGNPKAIVKSHRSILAFVESFMHEFSMNKEIQEIFGNQANFDFDVSAKDVFLSVAVGATLCLIPNNCFLVPKKLGEFIYKNNITTLVWAASAIKFIKRYDCFREYVPSTLKNVFFSGETMQTDCIDYWKSKLPDVRFVNLYAPSEVTGNCLYYVVENKYEKGILPLTHKFSNIDVLILDETGHEINDGQKGEIYVRGSFLSKGYFGMSELTSQKFIQNPLHNKYVDIVYRTGDYVRKDGDKLYFLGRIDNQIKHMGHRIELEDIEECYSRENNGEEVCVIYDSEKEKIVLLTACASTNHQTVVNSLKTVLPKYMIPHEVVHIPEMPYNERGKKDRKTALQIYKEM